MMEKYSNFYYYIFVLDLQYLQENILEANYMIKYKKAGMGDR